MFKEQNNNICRHNLKGTKYISSKDAYCLKIENSWKTMCREITQDFLFKNLAYKPNNSYKQAFYVCTNIMIQLIQ